MNGVRKLYLLMLFQENGDIEPIDISDEYTPDLNDLIKTGHLTTLPKTRTSPELVTITTKGINTLTNFNEALKTRFSLEINKV